MTEITIKSYRKKWHFSSLMRLPEIVSYAKHERMVSHGKILINLSCSRKNFTVSQTLSKCVSCLLTSITISVFNADIFPVSDWFLYCLQWPPQSPLSLVHIVSKNRLVKIQSKDTELLYMQNPEQTVINKMVLLRGIKIPLTKIRKTRGV